MNLFVLCFVVASLLIGSFSQSIEASATREIGSSPDDEVSSRTETFVQNEGIADKFEDVEKFVDDFLWPVDKLQASTQDEGRTFGVKRLQFMMMPMIYKMGIMMTMMMVLTVISLKGLAIGVILLVLKLSAIFGKIYAGTQPQAPIQGWPAQPQPVHVHVHNTGGVGPAYHHHQPYNGWESASGPVEDEHYYYKG